MFSFSKFKNNNSNQNDDEKKLKNAVNGKTSKGIEFRIGCADDRGLYTLTVFGTSAIFPLPIDDLSFSLGDVPVFAFLITEDEFNLKDKLSDDGEPKDLYCFVERILMECPEDRLIAAKYMHDSMPLNIRQRCKTMDDFKLFEYLDSRGIKLNIK